jgi:uncharacterized protein (DUF3084 family)
MLMQKELEQNIKILFEQITLLKTNYNKLFIEHQQLSENYNQLHAKYKSLKAKELEITQENKQIKLMAAINGNPDHHKLINNHINRLVREVDMCMAQIENNNM